MLSYMYAGLERSMAKVEVADIGWYLWEEASEWAAVNSVFTLERR